MAQSPFFVSLLFTGLAASVALAAPRVWIADQGNNQQGTANPNNRILEINPVNKKTPPDADGTDIIILRTVPSPAGAFLDELAFDNDGRLWCVVKNTPDQVQDGTTRIDKDTGAVQVPYIPDRAVNAIMEGLAWDGTGLWVTGVRDFSGPNGSVLTRIDPLTGYRIAPFDSGPLGTAGRVSIPGNICQGLLYDLAGFLWHSDSVINRIYKLDIGRLYDADPGNDNNLSVAEFSVPFSPKGMDWMGDKIWVASPRNGIWEFDPATGATRKLFSAPNWNLDGLAVLPGPQIVATPIAFDHTVYLNDPQSPDTFEVTNGGTGTLTYAISDNADWLSIDPTSGSSTGENDPTTITITYDLAGLGKGEYLATVTITSPNAINSPFTLPVRVVIETVTPDLDGDMDVDQEDFGFFQACYTGTGVIAGAACQKADFDGDQDVDVTDLGVFLRCHTKPNVPAERTCDD